MNKDERIKELEKISMRLFDMVHEGSNIKFKCEANDFYDTIKGQTLHIDSVSKSFTEKQMDDAYDKGFKDAMVKYRKD